MSRLGEVWMLTVYPKPKEEAVYAIVQETRNGLRGLIIMTPPSCEYLLGRLIFLSTDWFECDSVERIA